MPRIESISSLRDHAREISEFCHKQDEPVFLTTNGKGDLVVMSVGHFERMQAEKELFLKLAEAQAQAARGERGVTHKQMMEKMHARIKLRGA